MEEIIKKAIEGGYEVFYSEKLNFLDPLFWQALGKACGWKREFCIQSVGVLEDGSFDGDKNEDFSRDRILPEWKYRAIRFYEINLTQGFDKALEYLQTTLSPER